jgi:predicted ATPase
MAVMPSPPHDRKRNVPEMFSDIIMKLLAKNAEGRYHSAFGLKHDLKRCLHQFEQSGTIEKFTPGSLDIPTTLQIPEKLYGRERELAELISAFSQTAQGQTEVIMVSGLPGIGKSVLTNELHKPTVEHRGYFASGKFDQFKPDVPYSAFQQAFKELICHILCEKTERINEWRAQFIAALGPNGQIIVDLIPELELVIGKQMPVESLPPIQSQNRFKMVFSEFVKVFISRKHPLVLFLDDMQWADLATLKLVETLVVNPEMKSFLFIGAYRNNEVTSSHPLMLALNEIGKAGVMVREVPLKALPVKGIAELIADTLACRPADAEPLAEVVMDKTHGNPFFINQFLRSLYQKQMILYDTQKNVWTWDIMKIKEAEITSNVVEFMCSRIQQLSSSARNTLTVAACIGNTFDQEFLAQISEASVAETAGAIKESQMEGLLVPVSGKYKYVDEYKELHTPLPPSGSVRLEYMFLHDRIQQAAYSLIPEDHKQKIHFKVGSAFLEQEHGRKREDRLFDIVQHLNLGAEQMTSQSERNGLAELNLQACRKAKAASAYDTAWQFAEKGIALIGMNRWSDNYTLCCDLSMEKAECDYLVGNTDSAETLLAEVLEKVRTYDEKAQVYDLKTVICALHGKLIESVQAGLSGLGLLDVHVLERPGKAQVALEFGKANFFVLKGLILRCNMG